VITLPLGGKYPAGGGLSYQLTLVYNGQPWERQQYDTAVQAIPTGWTTPGSAGMVSPGALSTRPNSAATSIPITTPTLSPDGSRHAF